MKDEIAKLIVNTGWNCPQESLRNYQKRDKLLSEIYVFRSYKDHKDEFYTFRLTRISE